MFYYTSTSFLIVVLIQYSFSCICIHNNDTNVRSRLKGETGDIKEKRQLHLDDYSSLEFLLDTEQLDTEMKRVPNQTYIVTNVTSTELNIIDKEENITSVEIKDITIPEKSFMSVIATTILSTFVNNDKISMTDTTSETNTIASEQTTTKEDLDNEDLVNCKQYKKTKHFDLTKISDVWKITFYTLPTALKCFKLYIKSLTAKDQLQYENKYGTFDGKVIWNNCILEITSSDHKRLDVNRRHFLQKNDSNFGVLTNVIIDQERNGNTKAILHEENPDQWLVLKNLLLMRDCGTGDIVVFSRVPAEPGMKDIEDALVEFGETGPVNGTRACEDLVRAWVKVG